MGHDVIEVFRGNDTMKSKTASHEKNWWEESEANILSKMKNLDDEKRHL